MKYQIVSNEDIETLEHDVSLMLSNGWECQGGVSISRVEYEYMNPREGYKEIASSAIFAQALIKRDTSP